MAIAEGVDEPPVRPTLQPMPVSMPPIYRFVAWLEYRRTLCRMCLTRPRVMDANGDDRYCSDECAEWDGEMQAHG